ncbi:transposase [Pseudomonas citronellolis]|uniref:IS110 family transposase n=1 Tax=Pseudomonas citronellolis TaxID=53408 RepID=UPI00209CF6E0|nr:IS110 family transposase [Pseudomonas citronellolis]MCP1643874.1 transposase [Pseudomonas citronellolis]MCP1666799.1 transposase [Pseudomonas citronellolis]MCP1697498.1 transposase [Pseudomonas citronellolis]MCP1704338.1 transposase [Pseudomonas citronellolis]MCP1796797.1 transposase [Pseudomonas citronellolis]
MAIVVGVDIAKKTFDIAVLQSNGKYRTKGNLSNDQSGFSVFDQWLQKHAEPGAWVVMEATNIYHEALGDYLLARGYRVCVMNPARIASYAQSQLQRVKTDKVDAKLIALYGARHAEDLQLWQPDPVSVRQLRALVRRYEELKERFQMEINRLETAKSDVVKESILSVSAHLEQQIEQTLEAIRQHIDDDPDLRGKRDLLTSIEGISDKTAALLLAELGSISRFESARAVVAFAGLNPRLRESGQHKGQVRISKIGSRLLRAGLFMPAICAMSHNQAIRALRLRLEEKGKAGKQIICAAMRKLLQIAYGVLKSGQPYNVELALARG